MKSNHLIPITVLIPVYNAGSFLAETIESVLYQTFRDFELLLLDDGSTDNSRQIVSLYNDNRIHYVHCDHDFIGTLNKGLSLARGKYIALLDHDDLMVPKRLQIQFDYLEANPSIVACGGYMHSFGKTAQLMTAPLEYAELIKDMVIYSPMLNPTGFIRREAILTHQIKYQRGYSFAADFKFWSDLIIVGKITNIPEVLTLYRSSERQTSQIYRRDSERASHKIQNEVVDYLLSLIDEDNPFYTILDDQLLPALIEFGEHSFFSSRSYFPFIYEIINGLIMRNAIRLPFINYSEMIKVGFLVSFDYKYLEYALPAIYQKADQIFLAIDKDRLTWTGTKFHIPDSFFQWMKDIDPDRKVRIYEDSFFQPELTAMECETRERNLLAKKMGKDGWHIQLDVDEYFVDFDGFVSYLCSLDYDISTTIYAQLITIYKHDKDHIFYIDSNEEFPLATNNPQYVVARKTGPLNIIKKTKYKILHQSWGRSHVELKFKLSNWGHTVHFDVDKYMELWDSLNDSNYRFFTNFHPLQPELWKSLKCAKENNIPAFIRKIKCETQD